MDILLRRLEEVGAKPTGFADDLLLIVEADSTREVARLGTEYLEVVAVWGKEVGVEISKSKTNCMYLSGKSSNGQGRPMLDGERIPYVKTLTYLGVHVSEGLDFSTHLKRTSEKLDRVIHPLKRVLRKEWGIKDRSAMVWYKGLLMAVALYGCTVWGAAATSHAKGRREIQSIQKKALLACTVAYRTTSVASLQVITGSIPWDLEIGRRVAMFRAKRGLSIPQVSDAFRETESMSSVKVRVLEHAIEEWQSRWDCERTGRITFSFIERVDTMSKLKVTNISRGLLVLTTGHGVLYSYLKQYGHRDTDGCECGLGTEDVIHIVLSCESHTDLRVELSRAIGRDIDVHFPLSALFTSRESIGHFARFAEAVFSRREEIQLLISQGAV